MENKRNIVLTKEIPNTKYTHLQIGLSHSHGGTNYFDNTIQKAGYYLHFRPITIEDKDGYGIVSFCLFDKPELSYKINIYNKYRKSKKTLEELWKIAEDNMQEIFEAWETLIPTNVYKVVARIYNKYLDKGDC